ncbi:MAG: hypothetical protein H6594_12840 [Flavobacteriales bacterium]|nr:hypothetical protein [Flavobacteriales bacterium]
MRRWLVLAVLLGVVAFGTWQLFDRLSPTTVREDPWSVMPGNAAVVIELPDPGRIWDVWSRSALLWGSVADLPACVALDSMMQRLHATQAGGILNGPLLIALVRTGGDHHATFAAMGFPGGGDQLRSALGALGANEPDIITTPGSRYVTWAPDSALPVLHLAAHDGLLIATDNADLLNEALAADQGVLPQDPLRDAARRTFGAGADAHVLLRTGPTWRMLSEWCIPEVIDRMPWPEGWVAFDVRSRSQALLMSGLFITSDSSAFPGSEPSNVHQVLARQIPGTATWLDVRSGNGALRDFPDTLRDQVRTWLGSGMASASADTRDGAQRWVALDLVDTAAFIRALVGTPADGSQWTSLHRGIVKLHAPSGTISRSLHLEDPWCAVIGGIGMLANSEPALDRMIDARLDGSSLGTDLRTATVLQQYGSEAERTIWTDLARDNDRIATLLRPGTCLTTPEAGDRWERTGQLLFQVDHASGGRAFLTLTLAYSPLGTTDTGISPLDALWQLDLAATPAGTPGQVIDHDTRLGELLVPTTDSSIALVGTGGKLLWQRKLDGPVLGAVAQVDRYHNGKLQMLLCTPTTVWTIDRKGRDVEGTPIHPEGQLAAPAAVFDYDGKGEHRVLVPMMDGRLLNYGLDGGPVKGWHMPRTDAPAASPIRHLRIKGKDLLVLIGRDGVVHAFDRRGDDRYEPKLKLGRDPQVLTVRPGTSIGSSLIIWRDPEGDVRSGQLDGRTQLLVHAANGAIAWDEGAGALAFVRSDTLVLREESGATHRTVVGSTIDDLSLVQDPTDHALRVIVHATDGRLLVFDQDGTPLRSPGAGDLRMALPLDLDRDGRTEWVTIGPGGHIACYGQAP